MPAPKLTLTHWLIIIIASLGFLFDTYQLLMTPLVGPAAISELLKVPLSNPLVSDWMGNLLWLSALSGGVFGLLGGWLTDRLGRKFVMALGIFVYSLSPVAGAFSTTLGEFVFWRCATFVGVCIEFVAAITWIAEVFSDKAQKEKWLGITQLFASLGGVLVTFVNFWILAHAKTLPHLGMPMALGAADPASWRYLLLTGIIPALLIALMLPFVPESSIWLAKRQAIALPRFRDSIRWRKFDIVPVLIGAYMMGAVEHYGFGKIFVFVCILEVALCVLDYFGAILKHPQGPLTSFKALFSPELRRAAVVTSILSACVYGVAFGALQLTPGRIAPGLPNLAEQRKELKPLVDEAKTLNAAFDATKPGSPERKAALEPIKANFAKQKPIQDQVKEVGSQTQAYQEIGGLAGRIVLALLIIVGISRRLLLRLLQVPGLIILPLTYFMLYKQDATVFSWGIAIAGFVTMSQLSFLGEYLPKVFPIHLRGTGGSFATNVGGRMIGTSAAFLTPKLAQMFTGSPYDQMAHAAGWMGFGIVIIGIVAGMFLPEPKEQAADF